MLKHHDDVLGLALKDYYCGRKKAQVIIHSPDFEDDVIPVSYYFRNYKDMPSLEKQALDFCEGKILDAGAGAGSHSLVLQERGLNVTALDNSALACDVMRDRGILDVVKSNFFEYQGQKYDTLLMLMNGIGICGSLVGLRKFLGKLPSLLNKGGKFIFDSTNLIYLFEQMDGSVLMNLNDRYYGEIEFSMEYNNYIGPEFSWLYIDFDTLDDICEEEGLNLKLLEEGPQLSFLAAITMKSF